MLETLSTKKETEFYFECSTTRVQCNLNGAMFCSFMMQETIVIMKKESFRFL